MLKIVGFLFLLLSIGCSSILEVNDYCDRTDTILLLEKEIDMLSQETLNQIYEMNTEWEQLCQ